MYNFEENITVYYILVVNSVVFIGSHVDVGYYILLSFSDIKRVFQILKNA